MCGTVSRLRLDEASIGDAPKALARQCNRKRGRRHFRIEPRSTRYQLSRVPWHQEMSPGVPH